MHKHPLQKLGQPDQQSNDAFSAAQLEASKVALEKKPEDIRYHDLLRREIRVAVDTVRQRHQEQQYPIFPTEQDFFDGVLKVAASSSGKKVVDLQQIFKKPLSARASVEERHEVGQTLKSMLDAADNRILELSSGQNALDTIDTLHKQLQVVALGGTEDVFSQTLAIIGKRYKIDPEKLRELVTDKEKMFEEKRLKNSEKQKVVKEVLVAFLEIEESFEMLKSRIDIEDINVLIDESPAHELQKRQWRTLLKEKSPRIKGSKRAKIIALTGAKDFSVEKEESILERVGVTLVSVDNTKVNKSEYLQILKDELCDTNYDTFIIHVSSHGLTKAFLDDTIELNSAGDTFAMLNQGSDGDEGITSDDFAKVQKKSFEIYREEDPTSIPKSIYTLDACFSGSATIGDSLLEDTTTTAILASSAENQVSQQKTEGSGEYMTKLYTYIAAGMPLYEAHVRADMYLYLTDQAKRASLMRSDARARQNPRAAVRRDDGSVLKVSAAIPNDTGAYTPGDAEQIV